MFAFFAAECLLLSIGGCKLVNVIKPSSETLTPSLVSGMRTEVRLASVWELICTQGCTQAFLLPKADCGQLLQFDP